MNGVFADTGFFLELINPKDQYHRAAVELNATLRAPLVTSVWILVELANALAGSRGRRHFRTVVNGLRSQADVFIASDPALFERGCQLYYSREDKDWSLTDCISFVIMKESELGEALTADHHFAQAGFRPLMKAG